MAKTPEVEHKETGLCVMKAFSDELSGLILMLYTQ